MVGAQGVICFWIMIDWLFLYLRERRLLLHLVSRGLVYEQVGIAVSLSVGVVVGVMFGFGDLLCSVVMETVHSVETAAEC